MFPLAVTYCVFHGIEMRICVSTLFKPPFWYEKRKHVAMVEQDIAKPCNRQKQEATHEKNKITLFPQSKTSVSILLPFQNIYRYGKRQTQKYPNI